MCKVGYTATLGPTYAIKSFLRCQSQRRRVVVNTLSFCISPWRNFAANHFPHKLRAAIILMSFKSFSVQRLDRKTNLGGLEMGSLCRIGSFFFVMQIYLESFFVWLKETNPQINHLSRLNAARSDRYRAELGNMTVAVLQLHWVSALSWCARAAAAATRLRVNGWNDASGENDMKSAA